MVILVAGCSQSATTGDMPARIKDLSLAGQDEIQGRIREALESANVRINKDAFANSSYLSLEHPTFRDNAGNPIMGRSFGKPIQFRLFTTGRDCILVYPETEQRWILNESECVVE